MRARNQSIPFLDRAIPRTWLIVLFLVGLIGGLVAMKEIVEERNRIATTQEIKWGWLTISAILNYAEQHSGKWPTKWSDLIQDNSRKVDIDFTLQTSDLAKNPNLIYQAVRLKDHPELQDGLKPELTELRQQVLNAQGH